MKTKVCASTNFLITKRWLSAAHLVISSPLFFKVGHRNSNQIKITAAKIALEFTRTSHNGGNAKVPLNISS